MVKQETENFSMKKNIMYGTILCVALIVSGAGISMAGNTSGLSTGQKVYVPAYSHIYSGNRQIQSLLTITLSVRNTDPAHAIEIVCVDYYDTGGNRLKRYQTSAVSLPPLGTANYVIAHNDKSGGSGANFLVEWTAATPVNAPIVETVMIGSRSSFTSRGQAIIPSD